MRAIVGLVVWLAAIAPVAAVEIDGRLDAGEWAAAQHVQDFRLTQPLSREPAPLPTEAWILSTPEGLAVAFRNTQPADVLRTRDQARRDSMGQVDRVNVMLDFDGDGRTGYAFTVSLGGSIADEVITSENNFNDDWDGIWQRAVTEDQAGWSAEMLIPWHIAPMRDGTDGTRTLGIYLDRVIGTTGQRAAWPAISFREPRFLSSFAPVPLAAYTQSLLAITPFVVGVYDNVGGGSELDAGADIFWKPSGRVQLTATLNPDFGQVESDDLVINFGAVETFFSDKRPFFTENQGLFVVPFGGANSRLLYTRRIGGQADDGSGAGDVAAAVKLNGSLGSFNYGMLAASESGDAGRDFYALRATRESEVHDFGGMLTHVNRPFLGREASVLSFDHGFTPSPSLDVRTQWVGSSIEEGGRRSNDSGGQLRLDHDFGTAGGWRQQFYGLHLGRDLQLNDIGFLDRNDFNYLRYELLSRISDYTVDSRHLGSIWRYIASTRHNDSGLHLADAFAINRQSQLRNGGDESWDVSVHTSGYDDLILRGNGAVKVPKKFYAFYRQQRPRKGRWAWEVKSRLAADGLEGLERMGGTVNVEPTYHFSDAMNLAVGVQLQARPDWLLWRGANLLGTFDSRSLQLNATFNWIIARNQELRVRLQAIGLDARAEQAWRVAADGTPAPSPETVQDFSLRNMGFQVRYRYELAPLSDLYIVYARGGAMFDESSRGADEQLAESFELRDDEQLLIKLSYRFEI
jgi:hypothetical protein